MFREIILPIFRSTRLCVTACGVMHPPRCCRPKQQLVEWRQIHSPHPTPKLLGAKIRWKIIASIFWDQDGILLIDYLSKGQTINAEYYLSLLVQLKDVLKGKRTPREGHSSVLVLARQ